MSDFSFDVNTRFVIVGCGKMGEAILAGIIGANVIEPTNIIAVAPRAQRRDYLEETYGITCVSHAHELHSFDIGAGDICMLAVKPQVLFDVTSDVKTATHGPLFVSIAAGITLDSLHDALGDEACVVRVMPNTPALVGQGCSLLSPDDLCSQTQIDAVVELFASFGKAYVIEEHLQNAGSAISGAGPAYFALIINALTRAGLTQGLKREIAEELSVATMNGTAAMLETLEIHPEQLIDMVTSPGGTTIAAINVLENQGLRSAFVEAIEAAVIRAEELAWESDDSFEEEE